MIRHVSSSFTRAIEATGHVDYRYAPQLYQQSSLASGSSSIMIQFIVENLV